VGLVSQGNSTGKRVCLACLQTSYLWNITYNSVVSSCKHKSYFANFNSSLCKMTLLCSFVLNKSNIENETKLPCKVWRLLKFPTYNGIQKPIPLNSWKMPTQHSSYWYNIYFNVVHCLYRHIALYRGNLIYHRPDDGGSTYLWNIGRYSIKNMTVHPRRFWAL
jgi:hypothetical protein